MRIASLSSKGCVCVRLTGLRRTTTQSSDELTTYTYTGQVGDITSIGQSFTFHQNRTADDFAGMAYEVGTSTVKWSIRLENIAEFLRGPQRVTMRYGLDSALASDEAGFDTRWAPERRNHTPRGNVTTYYLTLNRPSGRAVARVEVFDLALVDGDTAAHLRPIAHAIRLRPAASGVRAGFMLELAFPDYNDTLAYDPAIGMGTLLHRDDGKGGSGDNSAMVIGVAVAVPLAIVCVVVVIVIGVVVGKRRQNATAAMERAINFDSNCYVNSQVLCALESQRERDVIFFVISLPFPSPPGQNLEQASFASSSPQIRIERDVHE